MHPNEIRASFLKYFERHGHRIVPSSPLVPADDPDAALHQRRHEPVQGRVSRPREARLHARGVGAEVHARQRQAQRSRQRRARRSATTRSSRCSAISRSATTSRKTRFRWPGRCSPRSGGSIRKRLVATVFKGEQGIPRDDEAYDVWRSYLPAGADRRARDGRQLLGDGRHRAVRPLLGDLLRPRRPASPGTGDFMTDAAVGLRAVRRDLEQRLHGVRAAGRRRADATCRRGRSTPAWASSASPR